MENQDNEPQEQQQKPAALIPKDESSEEEENKEEDEDHGVGTPVAVAAPIFRAPSAMYPNSINVHNNNNNDRDNVYNVDSPLTIHNNRSSDNSELTSTVSHGRMGDSYFDTPSPETVPDQQPQRRGERRGDGGDGTMMMEPIPLHIWQAQGAPIGIDTDDDSLLAPEFQDLSVSHSNSLLAPSFGTSSSSHAFATSSNSNDDNNNIPSGAPMAVSTSESVKTAIAELQKKRDPQSPRAPSLPFPWEMKPSASSSSSAFSKPMDPSSHLYPPPDPTMTAKTDASTTLPTAAAMQADATTTTTLDEAANATGAKRKLYMADKATNKSKTMGASRAVGGTNAPQAGKRVKTMPSVIGPESPQMAFIRKLMEYLHQKEPQAYEQMHTIVKNCQTKHQRGARRSQNLPGSIFEQAVKVFGADEFNRMHMASQRYNASNDEAVDSNPTTVAHPPAMAAAAHQSYHNRLPVPSLVEVAVGYGFHLARTHFLHDNSVGLNTSEILAQGVDTVNRMNESERIRFWKYIRESPLFERTQQQQQQEPQGGSGGGALE